MAIDLVLFVFMRRDLFPTALCNAARLGLLATLLPASAFTAFAADSYTLFAPGVTKDSGWYDVNKKSTALNPTWDFMACWAAAPSNMLEYWQDTYKAAGNTLPQDVPTGQGVQYGYELKIFEDFLVNWQGEGTADPYLALRWYFTGEEHNRVNAPKPPKGSGGYWKEQYSEFEALLGENFIAPEIHCYSGWEEAGGNPLELFSNHVKEILSKGVASLVFNMGANSIGGALHATTLWGAELDALGIVTAVYLTDSDDVGKSDSSLRRYEVATSNGARKIVLSNTDYGTVGVTNLYGLTAYPIPEPSMFGALAGVFALSLAATRRKHRRS